MADVNVVNGNHCTGVVGSLDAINDCCNKETTMDMFSDTWGFDIEELYKISVGFFKGN